MENQNSAQNVSNMNDYTENKLYNKISFEKYYDLQKNEAGTIKGGWVNQMIEAFKIFLESKDKDSKILDIGCAYGCGILAMNELGYYNIIGVDLVTEKLEHGKKLGLDVLEMDMHNLKFNDNEFDYSFMSHVIEHSIDPVKTITEMIRVTKKMGFIIAPIEEANGIHSENSPHTSPFKSEDDWNQVLRKVESLSGIGFKTVRKFRLGEEIWTTFVKK
jgi:ubiquinone/menaquinone biosynthesis C-methylase UbiE